MKNNNAPSLDSSNKISVLIPDGDSPISMWVVMGLSQVKNIQVYILSNSKVPLVKYSWRIKEFFFLSHSYDQVWLEELDKIISTNDIDIVLPVSTDAIEILAPIKNKLTFKDKITDMPDIDSFTTSDDKGLLAKHLFEHNLPHPKTFVLKAHKESLEEPITFPAIIKPIQGYAGGEGISIFKNQKELEVYFSNNDLSHSYLIQEYIDGYDIDCSVLCKDGKIQAFTIQKGFLKGGSDFTPYYGVAFLFEQELFNVAEKLVASLNWSGVAHIDMRYDKNKGDFKVIEMNPRYWESLDASIAVGVNFPYLACLNALNIKFNTPKYIHREHLNINGLGEKVKNNILFLLKFKYIFTQTTMRFYKNDLGPFINILSNKIKAVFN